MCDDIFKAHAEDGRGASPVPGPAQADFFKSPAMAFAKSYAAAAAPSSSAAPVFALAVPGGVDTGRFAVTSQLLESRLGHRSPREPRTDAQTVARSLGEER